MLILSKKTGVIYENICLEKKSEKGLGYGSIDDTENMTEINFNDYVYGYTRLCDNCAKIANKNNSIEGVHCFNRDCKSDSSTYVGEVIFSEEEIKTDLIVYKR